MVSVEAEFCQLRYVECTYTCKIGVEAVVINCLLLHDFCFLKFLIFWHLSHSPPVKSCKIYKIEQDWWIWLLHMRSADFESSKHVIRLITKYIFYTNCTRCCRRNRLFFLFFMSYSMTLRSVHKHFNYILYFH
jgi:hypothetical protein